MAIGEHGKKLAKIGGGGIVEGATWDALKIIVSALAASALMGSFLKLIGEHLPAIVTGAAAVGLPFGVMLYDRRRRRVLGGAELPPALPAPSAVEVSGLTTRLDDAVAAQADVLKKTSEHLTDLITEARDLISQLENRINAEVLNISDRLNVAIRDAEKKNEEIDALREEIKSIPNLVRGGIRQYDRSVADIFTKHRVRLPADSPIGLRTPSGITLSQIVQDLNSCPSLAKLEHGRAYLGNFVIWDCRVSSLNHENGQLVLVLYVQQDGLPIFAPITVSVSEAENPRLKLLKKDDALTVDGRIYEINTAITAVTLDHANVTVKNGTAPT